MKTRHFLAATLLALLPLTAACNTTTHDEKHPAKSSAPATPAADPTTEEPAPDYTPTADDFLASVKTTQRQCFGSAGCNVTVEPDLTYMGTDTIDPDKTYSITYEIHGDESGPVIDTLTLSDGTSLHYHSSMLSTSSSGTEISIEITDVEETL
jgi:hypothetical protein